VLMTIRRNKGIVPIGWAIKKSYVINRRSYSLAYLCRKDFGVT
jgi:hypothetical protein